ncbi:MAG: type II secretion system protein GspD [Phycisphaerales bacterium]
MNNNRFTHKALRLALVLAAGLALSAPALGQEQQPEPAKPRVLDGPPAALAFKTETVDRIVPFITEVTGKVVIPQQDVLTRKITVLSQQPIAREKALDMLILALYQNGVAVVEGPTVITLRDITEIVRQDVPVVGPGESVLNRSDMGTIVEKVYALKHLTAKNVGDMLKDVVPDFAKRSIDEESNQIAVIGNVGLLQRLERLLLALDRPAAGALKTQTFALKYSDAETIKANIDELFGASSTSSTSSRNRNNNNNQGGGRGGPFNFGGNGGNATESASSANSEVRVTANSQQNSVTVAADPSVLDQISEQINEHWDLPVRIETVIPKTYELVNTDPVKMKTLLEGLFGSGSGSTTTTGGGGGGQNRTGGSTSSSSSQGAGRLAGQFSFESIPDTSRLVVVAKSPDNIAVIDKIIEDLDKPQTAGLPLIIELKHASAEDLAEQLNTLLAQDGTYSQIRRASSGLSADASSTSPFASSSTTTGTDGSTTTSESTTSDMIRFWWERSRPPTDRRNSSNLVGQLRIVPVWRQNALMVVAPPEYRKSVADLVDQLDKPGRQVLLSAIVAEVSVDDAKAFGLRWSSQTITPTNGDNSISIGNTAEGTRNNWATSLFDTSVINSSVDLNVLLQALAQKTDVSILSEPRIFTSDNQEAEFFDGQDIPFVTDSQTNTQGNLVQSFDYKAVGIQLRIRPRITVKRDVDLKVNLELSSIVPGETLFGGFVVDRRETTTQLIVKNQQTVVISGIMRSEDSDVVYKVPILGDIPLLGWIFKSKERTKKNTELLVFITPIVVDNTDQSDEVNAPFQDRLKALRGQLDPDNKHNTDDSSRPGTPGAEPEAAPETPPKN